MKITTLGIIRKEVLLIALNFSFFPGATTKLNVLLSKAYRFNGSRNIINDDGL